MKFFDPKEDIIDMKITPHGKYLLSMGRFQPTMYAFFDDDILYDNKFAQSGSTTKADEPQNDIEPRIQENTPRIKTQTMYRGSQIGVFHNNPNVIGELMPGIYQCKDGVYPPPQSPDKEYLLYDPLGTSAYNSDKMPAWAINFLKAPLVSAEVALTGANNEIPTTFIPQLNCDIKNKVDKIPFDAKLQNIYYGEGNSLQPIEESDSEIYDDQIVFPNGTSLEYTKDFILLQVEEANTEFIKDNFKIEIFEIKSQTNALGEYSEVLKKLYFDDKQNKSNASDYVEHFFDIEIDDEIDPVEFCALSKQNNKIENIYVDNTFICPDKTKAPTVSLNIYSTGDNENEKDVC